MVGAAPRRPATTTTHASAAIADATHVDGVGGRYARSQELGRRSWPTAWGRVRAAPSLATAGTGIATARYLWLRSECVTQTGWPSSAARRSPVPAVRLPRYLRSSGGLRSAAAMPARPARARAQRRPTTLGPPWLLSCFCWPHRAIRTNPGAVVYVRVRADGSSTPVGPAARAAADPDHQHREQNRQDQGRAMPMQDIPRQQPGAEGAAQPDRPTRAS